MSLSIPASVAAAMLAASDRQVAEEAAEREEEARLEPVVAWLKQKDVAYRTSKKVIAVTSACQISPLIPPEESKTCHPGLLALPPNAARSTFGRISVQDAVAMANSGPRVTAVKSEHENASADVHTLVRYLESLEDEPTWQTK